MTVSNKYLVQALRAYREKSVGQFDQVTEHAVQVTQDAADEIERLNALVEELGQRKIAIGVRAPILTGSYIRRAWEDVAELLAKDEGSGITFYTLVADGYGIEAYGSYLPKGEKK